PNPGTRSAALTRMDPPTDGAVYPAEPTGKKPAYYAGNLIAEDSGQIVGTITMGWISNALRRATVEIDHVKGAEPPGKLDEWQKAFADAQWQIDLRMDNPPIVEPPNGGGIWTIGQLHEALFKLRIRRMTNPAVIKKAEADLDKKLEVMSLTEIRDHILIDPAQFDLLDRE